MADMFAPLVAQLKANPKTIVFTEGNDPRSLEAASKLLAEGVLKVVMVATRQSARLLPPPVTLIFPLPRSSTLRITLASMRWSTPWWSCARASRPLRSALLC